MTVIGCDNLITLILNFMILINMFFPPLDIVVLATFQNTLKIIKNCPLFIVFSTLFSFVFLKCDNIVFCA